MSDFAPIRRAAPLPPVAPPRAGGPTPLAICSGRRLRSADLFGSQQEVEIEHGPSVYRLRLTSLGKLILTK